MSFLIDNCVPRKYLSLLKSWGYNAALLSQHIPADSADPDVLKLAQTLDAVLLTVDLDFSNILLYPPQNYVGIMVMRYAVKDEAALTATLQTALNSLKRDELRGALVIVEPRRYRVRR